MREEDARSSLTEHDGDRAFVGRLVTVRFLARDEDAAYFLGSPEMVGSSSVSVLSLTSPLGAALVGHSVGDRVTYTGEGGTELAVRILKVEPWWDMPVNHVTEDRPPRLNPRSQAQIAHAPDTQIDHSHRARTQPVASPLQPLRSQLRTAAITSLILDAHSTHVLRLGSRGPLPVNGPASGPGILYVIHDTTGEVDVVQANSLALAVAHLADPELEGTMERNAYWAYGDIRRLVNESPILATPRTAGRKGRPTKVTSAARLRQLPDGAGVYRIYKFGKQGRKAVVVYIGRTNSFRRRLSQHEKIPRDANGQQCWGGPGGVDRIELIYAKGCGQPGVWTAVDLDELEARKIKLARQKHEDNPSKHPRVENDTDGRNGPPSRALGTHYYRWLLPVPDEE